MHPIWRVAGALAIHATSTLLAHTMGVEHLIAPNVPPLFWMATLAIPAIVVWQNPRRERSHLVRRATTIFSSLLTLGGIITVLPPTTGPLVNVCNHSALVASYVLQARSNSALVTGVAVTHAASMLVTRSYHTTNVLLTWVIAALCVCLQPPLRTSVHLVKDRHDVYRARHEVYAEELCQYPRTPTGMLTDPTDSFNEYIVVSRNNALQGFIAITPPGSNNLAMHRHGLKPTHPGAYEFRLLTVLPGCRQRGVMKVLMYAALRYIEACGGTRIAAMARLEVLPIYLNLGMRQVSEQHIQSGKVTYVHIEASTQEIRDVICRGSYIPKGMSWDLPFAETPVKQCMHGGLGLETLHRQAGIVSADVLDAWYPPAPEVLESVSRNLTEFMSTTPPTSSSELLSAIANASGVNKENIVVGAGSSDLIYRFMFSWLSKKSRVLIMEPTYAEYSHVLDVIGCKVDRIRLRKESAYKLTPDVLPLHLERYDLVIFVNPNSPTGKACPEMLRLVQGIPKHTRVWVDETYVDFIGTQHSLEHYAATSPNVVVCKSMSKVYALSGTRLAYACGHPIQLDLVRTRAPPWMVSRLAQVAGVQALNAPEYYAQRIQETHALRVQMEADFKSLGFDVLPGCANFFMCFPPFGLPAKHFVQECQGLGLYVRNVGTDNAVRIAVKDASTNQHIVKVTCKVLAKLAKNLNIQRSCEE